MPLVDYSSDSSVDSDRAPRSKKRKISSTATTSLPPLPNAFRDLYATSVRSSTVDDPSLHAGRQRITPHIEGNWPTHVYTEC
jgi:U6 snRNA phosphodiesterase